MVNPPRYCTDCKWFRSAHQYWPLDMCGNPQARDAVGRHVSAEWARSIDEPCGPYAALFVPLPPSPPPAPKRAPWWRRLFARV